jgi:TPR repeat protein
MEGIVHSRAVIFALLAGVSAPALSDQDATFTDIRPGDISVDPANLITGANMGDVRAINNLGLLWARGVGTDGPNYGEALRWWKEGARRGYSLSMNNIGLLYANGHGVKQSYDEAYKWWEMSADTGDAWAMNSIGDLYENGHGVQQSYSEALSWYQRAAEGGDGLGMYNLAHFYEEGLAGKQDLKAAMKWYERAADKGVGVSMHRLGLMIAQGRGQPADPAEGQAWLTVAGKYFSGEDAEEAAANARALEALTAQLSATELERAREIAHNLEARIEERRKADPMHAGPGEKEV